MVSNISHEHSVKAWGQRPTADPLTSKIFQGFALQGVTASAYLVMVRVGLSERHRISAIRTAWLLLLPWLPAKFRRIYNSA